jgi:hypothetical protein
VLRTTASDHFLSILACRQHVRLPNNPGNAGIHGRIARREQVQISLGFAQHQGWVGLFMDWWEYAIRSWRKRERPDAVLTFLCELGPPPYAVTGADRAELTDRWQEALQ